jgi:hypothetical protein
MFSTVQETTQKCNSFYLPLSPLFTCMDRKIKEVMCSKFVCVTATTQLRWIVTIRQTKISSCLYRQFVTFLGSWNQTKQATFVSFCFLYRHCLPVKGHKIQVKVEDSLFEITGKRNECVTESLFPLVVQNKLIHVKINLFIYYYLFSLALQPSADYDLIVDDVSWSHTATHHSR